MAFPSQTARAYTRESVQQLLSGQMGCYGLYRENRWIYVGSGDIRQRLLDHLNGDNPCIVSERPTAYVTEPTSNYIEREKQLIAELETACNRKLG